MNYTKGKWKTNKNYFGSWTISTEETHIADVDRHFNANLIVAAPEMYEALKDIRKFVLGVDALGPTDSQVIATKCWLALAKAEGGK